MVTVVVVNWNSGPLLEKCVASLLRHAADCEIIVVDNASEDGSTDFIAPGCAGPAIVRSQENLGFAAACNIGWRRAGGDCVLFLNPDVECLEGAVEGLRRALEDRPSCWGAAGALGPADGSGSTPENLRRLPTLSSVAAEMLMLDEIWPGNPWTSRYRMRGENLLVDQSVEQPAAACLMMRRRALDFLGGFDEGFRPAWFEDVDLCRRTLDAGGTILFHPSARFLHQGGYSLGRLPYTKFVVHYHSNLIRYFDKHHGADPARRVRRLVVAGMYLRAAASLVRPLARGASRADSFRLFRGAARRFSAGGEGAV